MFVALVAAFVLALAALALVAVAFVQAAKLMGLPRGKCLVRRSLQIVAAQR